MHAQYLAHRMAHGSRQVKKLSICLADNDMSIVLLLMLPLKLHPLYLEISPLLFVLSIKNSLGSVESSGHEQM